MHQEPEVKPTGPLQGIRVIDLTSVILGSFASQMLGDLGAEVLKIETPSDPATGMGGDIMRWAGPAPIAGMGPLFLGFNRNKRSIALDLRQQSSCDQLLGLVKSADVFVASIRYRSLEKLGLDYPSLRTLNPRLIYAHACGFGSAGPYANLPAYDDLIQAASGGADLWARAQSGYSEADCSSRGYSNEAPTTPRYLPGLFADKTVGLYLVNAILAALLQRQCGAQEQQEQKTEACGQFIEVPMLECYTHFIFSENLYGNSFVPALADYGYPRVLNPQRKPYRSSDGFIAILPYSDIQWQRFFEAAGCEGLFDQRFQNYQERGRNIQALYALMEQIVVGRTSEAWITLLRPLDIPVMPVYSLEQVRKDPHLQAVNLFQYQRHPQLGTYISLRHPVQYSDHPVMPQAHPPLLGEGNATFLSGAADAS